MAAQKGNKETRDLAGSVTTGGCGECQTSCQSACKTYLNFYQIVYLLLSADF